MSFPTTDNISAIESSYTREKRAARLGKGKAEIEPPPVFTPDPQEVLSKKQSKGVVRAMDKAKQIGNKQTEARALRALNKKIQNYAKRFPAKLKEAGVKIKASYRTLLEAQQVYDDIREIFDSGQPEEKIRMMYPWAASQLEQFAPAFGFSCPGYGKAIAWSLAEEARNPALNDMLGEMAIEYGGSFRMGLWGRFLGANAVLIAQLHIQNKTLSVNIGHGLASKLKDYINNRLHGREKSPPSPPPDDDMEPTAV
jgi:hypothetical protein